MKKSMFFVGLIGAVIPPVSVSLIGLTPDRLDDPFTWVASCIGGALGAAGVYINNWMSKNAE